MLDTAPTPCARRFTYRRKPETTALHRIVEAHLPAFFERLDAGGAGADWPGFVTASLMTPASSTACILPPTATSPT